jgi:hypothetical protein
LAGRTEAAIADPLQIFTPTNAALSPSQFGVTAKFPRTWLTVGRVGLRGYNRKNYMEVGIQGGEAFGAYTDFRFLPSSGGPPLLECPVTAGQASLGTCVMNSTNLVPGARFVVDQNNRVRSGPYWKWRFSLPIGSRVQLQANDEGDFFFNASGDNSTDGRYRNQMTTGFQFKVFPSLSFEPQYILFLYSNKVDYHFLWQQQTQIKINWSFDLHTKSQLKGEFQYPHPPQ